MKTDKLDKFLFQAMDAYPSYLEETVESLGYALSYDEKNTMALCLFGRLHAEQLYDYESAKMYFEQALSENINALEVYPYFIDTLLINEDYEQAGKLIDFALTIKGCNKAEILLKKVMFLERKRDFKQAKAVLKEVKLHSYNSDLHYFISDTEKRIKEKMELTGLKKDKEKAKGKKKTKSKKKNK
ncbi:hypothetical protein [Flavobacterium sp. UBA4197]|uniref:hypothetical protein n=1 Tax=Flavobacterium sp. UBA4197 TaxID=1946546 RepID=UPI00257B23A3|nr:hypothetical protein [Flavobacterium sp. UBA4197]